MPQKKPLKKAFKAFPAIVVQFGTQTALTAPPSFFQKLIGQRPPPTTTLDQADHVARIIGNLSMKLGGLTKFGSSVVYYGSLLSGAQVSLDYLRERLPSDASQTMTDDQDRALKQLLVAIGLGIGNTVAHEIGHQFVEVDSSMDCDRPPNYDDLHREAGPICPGPAPENLYEYYMVGEPQYAYAGLPLRWTPENAEKLRNLFLIPREAR